MVKDPIVVGIDLGTTKSVIGFWRNGKPLIIPDKAGNFSIPSLVLVTSSEEIFAGTSAKRHPERYKGKNITISSVKRLMGKKGETGWGWWKTYPQEVSAFVLAELKNQAEVFLGEEVKKAVIAIPSHFDENQRRATKEATVIADLEVLRLLNEATAAALAYGHNRQRNEKILIFDLGGGTCDISILEIGEGVFEVRCTVGDSRLGGDDFDQVIVSYIMDKLTSEFGKVEFDHTQKLMLKEKAETAKKELSSNQEASIYIPGFIRNGSKYNDLNITIDRNTFEELSKSLFERINMLLNRALNDSNITPIDLDSILLLGGSSRIPYVKNLISSTLGAKSFTGVDPETCVAQGAIIEAAVLSGKVKDVLLLDVIPSSYGIGLIDGVFSPIIERNTTIPARKSHIFTTSENDQTTIPITIYQGERELVKDNTYLTSFELKHIPPAPKGVPKIEMSFDISRDNILHVSAKDLGTGRKQVISVKGVYGLNNTQIKVMKERLKSWIFGREIKTTIAVLKNTVKYLFSKNVPALNRKEILNLEKKSELLDKIIEKGVFDKKAKNTISSAQVDIEKAQLKVVHYERIVRDIVYLIDKIRELVPLLSSIDEKEAMILNQGKALLKDYMERKLPYDDLQNMFVSVRLGYIGAKVNMINKAIEDLVTSGEIMKCVFKLERKESDINSISQEMLMLREIDEIDLIVNLLMFEESENRKLIQQKVFTAIKKGKNSQLYFNFIVISFTDFQISSLPEDLLLDEEETNFLMPAIISRLNIDKPLIRRREAAQVIAKYFNSPRYIQTIIECLSGESDDEVKNSIIDYACTCPTEVLYDSLMKADSKTVDNVVSYKKIILKFTEIEDEKIRFFALDSLAKLPSEEIISILFKWLPIEKNKKVTEKIITYIGDLESSEVTPYLINLLMDERQYIRVFALSALEKNRSFMDKDTIKLINLTKKVLKKKSLGIREKIFLRRLLKKNPIMKDVIHNLRKYAKKKR